MTPQQVLDQAIIPAAKALGICDLPHLQIGFGTCAQESGFMDVMQSGGGPAIGYFQMEDATHSSLWMNFIMYRPKIKAALLSILEGVTLPPASSHMLTNPVYGAAMMFVKYFDCPGAIPADLNEQANYYKMFYNTPAGAATPEEYLANYAAYSAGITFASFTGE